MIKLYTKKPVKVEALQYTFGNLNDIIKFVGEDNALWNSTTEELFISTLEGTMRVLVGSYVIKSVRGEFYPCHEKIFEETYTQVK